MDNQSAASTPLTGKNRDMAEALAKSGIPLDTINRHLAADGVEPLEANPVAEAGRRIAQLKRDPSWGRRVLDGDAEANTELARLQSVISEGAPAREHKPSDYRFNTASLPSGDGPALAEFNGNAQQWAADLKLEPTTARTLVELSLDTAAETQGMSPEQLEEFGSQQGQLFSRVLGSDPAARLKAASDVLKREGGRNIDLMKVAKSCGAEVALSLVLHAEWLVANKSN